MKKLIIDSSKCASPHVVEQWTDAYLRNKANHLALCKIIDRACEKVSDSSNPLAQVAGFYGGSHGTSEVWVSHIVALLRLAELGCQISDQQLSAVSAFKQRCMKIPHLAMQLQSMGR